MDITLLTASTSSLTPISQPSNIDSPTAISDVATPLVGATGNIGETLYSLNLLQDLTLAALMLILSEDKDDKKGSTLLQALLAYNLATNLTNAINITGVDSSINQPIMPTNLGITGGGVNFLI